jgi:hypothetical protein
MTIRAFWELQELEELISDLIYKRSYTGDKELLDWFIKEYKQYKEREE